MTLIMCRNIKNLRFITVTLLMLKTAKITVFDPVNCKTLDAPLHGM